MRVHWLTVGSCFCVGSVAFGVVPPAAWDVEQAPASISAEARIAPEGRTGDAAHHQRHGLRAGWNHAARGRRRLRVPHRRERILSSRSPVRRVAAASRLGPNRRRRTLFVQDHPPSAVSERSRSRACALPRLGPRSPATIRRRSQISRRPILDHAGADCRLVGAGKIRNARCGSASASGALIAG